MARMVLLLGKSGTGKSTSMRNFKDEDISIVNVIGKEMPFRSQLKSVIQTDDYERIKQLLLNSKKKVVVIDDAGYLITNQFMKNHSKTGGGNNVFQLYNDMADQFWKLLDFIKTKMKDDQIVYIIMHEDYDDRGNVKPKTIGKLLDEKVCIEGMFAIVLRSGIEEGKYVFYTNNEGLDATKSPMGLFPDRIIDNDLVEVDKAIRDYYNMDGPKQDEGKA